MTMSNNVMDSNGHNDAKSSRSVGQLHVGIKEDETKSKKKNFLKRASAQILRTQISRISIHDALVLDCRRTAQWLCVATIILLVLGVLSLPIIFHFVDTDKVRIKPCT